MQDSSPPATLTPDQSTTFDLPTLPDTPNAISSPASEAGAWRFALPDGRIVDPAGLVPHLANLSASQVRALGLATSGIYGPAGCTSSASAALQSSLASRLTQRFGNIGSILFSMTSKTAVTPAGRRYFLLRALARRTDDTARGSWPTVTTPSGGLTSPGGTSATGRTPDGRKIQVTLELVAKMASWPTAGLFTEAKANPPVMSHRKSTDPQISLADVAVHCFPWPSAQARDAKSASCSEEHTEKRLAQGRGKSLTEVVSWAAVTSAWPTVTRSAADKGVRTSEGAIKEAMRKHGPDLGAVAFLAHGTEQNGSSAEMASPVSLNPEFCRWLQGYPEEWGKYAPTGIR